MFLSRFTPEGALQWQLGLGSLSAALLFRSKIALDGQDKIYLSPTFNRLAKIDPNAPPPPSPPAPPSGLRAEKAGAVIRLTWSDNSTDERGFRVVRSDAEGRMATISGDLPPGTTQFDEPNLNNGLGYHYHVRAFNEGGESVPSNVVQVVHTFPPAPPLPPGPLAVVDKTETAVRLRWADNSDNEQGFRVERQNPDGSFTPVGGDFPAGARQFDDRNLQPGGTYTYRVKAFNVSGESAPSNMVTVTLVTPPCPQGDANLDGRIDISDAVETLKIAVGLVIPESSCLRGAADVNCSGRIDAGDATLLLQNLVFGTAIPPCATPASGDAFSWGANEAGQLGDGSTSPRSAPGGVAGASAWIAVSAGEVHSLGLTQDRRIWAWGGNEYGQLGPDPPTGPGAKAPAPVLVRGVEGVRAIAAGDRFSLALKADGTVWSWGSNWYGNLGNPGIPTGPEGKSPLPVQVEGLAGVTAIGAGGAHALALKSDGTVWAWGGNAYGQVGNGSFTTGAPYGVTAPVRVIGLEGVIAVAADATHSFAVKGDGSVWAWGSNWYGQLGNPSVPTGPEGKSAAPVQVEGITGAAEVDSGGAHVLVLKQDGTVWGWGGNFYGQLGTGSFTTTGPYGILSPVQVSGLDGVVSVSAEGEHSLAVRQDGTVWAWGSNEFGQLGVRSVATGPGGKVAIPHQVEGLTGATSVSAGRRHSLAVSDPPPP